MTPQDTSFWETRPADHDHMDWPYTDRDWIEGYKESVKHPHRQEVLGILRELAPFDTLLEVGCSAGPNLALIQEAFPSAILTGIDPNPDSVERAMVPNVVLGDVRNLPIMVRYDVILADASLMYVTPEEIREVMNKLALVARDAVVIVDRYNPSKLGEVTGGVWGRDYETLLKERGFRVESRPMTEESWPTSKNWQLYGRYFIGQK